MDQLDPPMVFPFPFEPYDIQTDFMKNIFQALENGKLGIFESPTGTGKSLSLICGALTWLQQHNRHYKDQLEIKLKSNEKKLIERNESYDWFSAADKRYEEKEEINKIAFELNALKKQEERVHSLRKRHKVIKHCNVKKVNDEFDELFRDIEEVRESVKRELNDIQSNDDLSGDEANLILDDYNSDDDNSINNHSLREDFNEQTEDAGCLKIYFCSRTHSQLSQFVREVKKTEFAKDARVVSLASRQNLCINDAVSKLGNISLINDRCVDLQHGNKGKATKVLQGGIVSKKKKSSSGCPFYKQTALANLADEVLLEVQDIEQLVTTGKKMKACPYYGSRFAIKDAQLVVLPYNTLLHRGTREACKIRLQDNIVIVDEAHNLLETISNIHSVFLSYRQLTGCHAQLQQYLQRYEKRLTPRNLLYIKQILFFVSAAIKLITSDSQDKRRMNLGNSLGNNSNSSSSKNSNTTNSSNNKGNKTEMMSLPTYMARTLIDNLNLFKLIQYIERSKIAHKLHGFSQRYEGVNMRESRQHQQQTSINHHQQEFLNKSTDSTVSFLAKMSSTQKIKENIKPPQGNASQIEGKRSDTDEGNVDVETVSGSPLMQVTEFMKALLGASVDGRISINIDDVLAKSSIKYLLLNPASHFHDIVQQCRSVIVAGGTMRPMEEFRDQLFLSAGADPDRLIEFSCGHIVPGEQILPIALSQGPSNTTLDFTFHKRMDPKILDELGRVIVNICNVVPGGIICFLPSYDYEQKVFTHFVSSGIIDKLSCKKKVFREPKKSSELDNILNSYSKIIKQCSSNTSNGGLTGAFIFSVVGGKMSEGINFSDNLGRCVIMVGLPYPNSFAPELKEKMEYLNKNVESGKDGRSAGSVFYENLCFKAVNQSIGRAIRHRDDYATIILLDHRFSRLTSVRALPEWISKHINLCEKFGPAFGLIRKFFANKR